MIKSVDQKMYVPYIDMTYYSLLNRTLTSTSLPFLVSTSYSSDPTAFMSGIMSFAVIMIVISVLLWMLQMFVYYNVQQQDMTDQYYYDMGYEAVLCATDIASTSNTLQY
jgi:hypothetical protein